MIARLEDRIVRFEKTLLDMNAAEARLLLTGPDGRPLPYGEIEALMVPALERIGQGWDEGEVALSQVYMSGRQCESLLKDLLPAASVGGSGGARIAIAALEDYHLLGLRLVSSVVRASGLPLLDYGRMDVEGLAKRASEDGVDILLVSVLMLRSALRVRELGLRLGEGPRRPSLIVGGAPFRLDKELWREVGADATSDTAAGALRIVRSLVEARKGAGA